MNHNNTLHAPAPCPLCSDVGGLLVFGHSKLRVIRAVSEGEAQYPAFYRVVWQAHVKEFSQLSEQDMVLCMKAVAAVEKTMLNELKPSPLKINLASLGNVVPHLHWHIIARYENDVHGLKPIWASAERLADAQSLAQLAYQMPLLDTKINVALAQVCV